MLTRHLSSTVIHELDLDPTAESMACCPKCYSCYSLAECPPCCVLTQKSKQKGTTICNRRLLKTSANKDGMIKKTPVSEIRFENFKVWLGGLLFWPGMEALLDRNCYADHLEPDTPMTDIWHRKAFKEFCGPDALPFVGNYGVECCLIFSLSFNGFNPF